MKDTLLIEQGILLVPIFILFFLSSQLCLLPFQKKKTPTK